MELGLAGKAVVIVGTSAGLGRSLAGGAELVAAR